MDRAGTGPGARQTIAGRRVSILLIALAVGGSALSVAVSAQARAKRQRHGADLVVTDVKLEVASEPYLVEERDGSTQDFEVRVTVKNIGDRTAARSLTRLTIEWGPLHRVLDEAVYPIEPLGPGKSRPETLAANDIKVRLGLLDVYVTPNWNFHVPELRYTNNRHLGGVIPVIAREWKVMTFSAHELQQVPGEKLDDTEQAQPGFFFKFDHLDTQLNQFVYSASGSLQDNASFTSLGCAGTGTGTASHAAWPFPSGLKLSYDLTDYLATLDTSNEDGFSFAIICPDSPGSTTHTSHFFDPLTYANRPGPVPMSPLATTLSGTGQALQAFTTITHTWQFEADVP